MNSEAVPSMTIEQTESPPSSGRTQISEPRGIEYANKTLPNVPRSFAGIEPYTGPWGPDQARHLLRRTLFGATPADGTRTAQSSLTNAVDQLLSPWQEPNPPVHYASAQEYYKDANGTEYFGANRGETWVTLPYNGTFDGGRIRSMQAWWTGLMITQDFSIREKMTLFLHNLLVSEASDVGDARLMYKQNALLRRNALGNFKELIKEITLDPAILRYLNGNTNTKNKPNENYARELQELFTIGKGPEIAPGNYTNYTEQDVIEAAKVLTGWRDLRDSISTGFTANNHDTTDKQFSSAYGNRVIKGKTGETGAREELDELLDMIFSQPETARNIVRELYRWFVYYVIDETAEQNVIEPLAQLFRSNGFELKPVLETLFKSAHFFDPINFGCMIKSPIDHVIGSLRTFSVALPDPTDVANSYNAYNNARDNASAMQQNLLYPPSVAGWPAYYQEPIYYQIWLNSDTIPKRFTYTDRLITGVRIGGLTIAIKTIDFVKLVSDPSDPNLVVGEFGEMLFEAELSDTQKSFLKEFLVRQNQDYEWTNAWNAYINNPTAANTKVVEDKLKALLQYMLTMAEYQLA